MDAVTLIVVLCAVGFGLMLVGLLIWKVATNKANHPGTGCKQSNNGWLWNPGCTSFQEITYDPTISSPASISPVLTDFTYSSGAGDALYAPVWYRFRYVNPTTGAYSDFSEWTKTPVIAGSCNLPCVPDSTGAPQCSFKQGYSTCNYNAPEIGINATQSQYDPTSEDPVQKVVMQINLHRYVGTDSSEVEPPAANVKDEIIGMLTTSFVGNDKYYTWKDVLSPPCPSTTNSCNKPDWCKNPNSTC